jgi:radical SAM protein with 4Fe4S-binding SPASM domain
MNDLTRPWSVQIELAEGCSRICSFCGINGIRSKAGNYKFMTIETATELAKQLADFCPDARMEFAMHGEPTMNPKHLEIISIFRAELPRAQMQITTNGVRMVKRDMQVEAEALFAAGIDFIVLDTYYPERDILRDKAFLLQGMNVMDYYDDMIPKKISPWNNYHRKMNNTIILMDDLEARNGESKARVIYNHAGNNESKGKLRRQLEKTCTIPFREVSIIWNGNVNICCQDWKGEFVVENIMNSPIKEIWKSPRWEAARTFLQNKDRSLSPCNKCDIGAGSRSGLLPKYGEITPEIEAIVGCKKMDKTQNEQSKLF